MTSLRHVIPFLLLASCSEFEDGNGGDGRLVVGNVRIISAPAAGADPRTEAILASAVNAQAPFPGLPDWALADEITISLGGRTGGGTVALSFPDDGIVQLPAGELALWDRDRLRVVLRHELAHIALHRSLRGRRVPRWVAEGYATWSSAPLDCSAASRIGAAVALHPPNQSTVFNLESGLILGSMTLTYDLYGTAVALLVDLEGVPALAALIARTSASSFLVAFKETYGLDTRDFEHRWQQYLVRRFDVLAECVDVPNHTPETTSERPLVEVHG